MYGVFGGSALVPPELRGRVFGAVKTGGPRFPWACWSAGVVVEAIGVAATFLGIGICYLAVTLYGFFNPAFRDMDEVRPYTEAIR